MVSVPQDMVSMIVAKAVNMSKKLNIPADGNGTSGQLLKTNGDGTTIWFTPEKLDHIANATGQEDAHTVLNSLLSALQEKGFMKTE